MMKKVLRAGASQELALKNKIPNNFLPLPVNRRVLTLRLDISLTENIMILLKIIPQYITLFTINTCYVCSYYSRKYGKTYELRILPTKTA